MTTADYALIVSICSTILSLAALAWNIWSKFIYPKPNLRVSFRAIVIMQGDDDPDERPRYLAIQYTNHGPTEIVVQNVAVIFQKRPFAKRQHALVNPIHNIFGDPNIGVGPFGGGLPKKLALGEAHTLYFPFAADSFARERLISVGVFDNFGRVHRCPRQEIMQVQKELDKAFPPTP